MLLTIIVKVTSECLLHDNSKIVFMKKRYFVTTQLKTLNVLNKVQHDASNSLTVMIVISTNDGLLHVRSKTIVRILIYNKDVKQRRKRSVKVSDNKSKKYHHLLMKSCYSTNTNIIQSDNCIVFRKRSERVDLIHPPS